MKGPGSIHREAIAALSARRHMRASAPEELFLFLSRLVPMMNVDLLIRGEERRVLLTWRDDRYNGAGWHVQRGIIRFGEPAEARLRRTAEEKLGATIEFNPALIAVEEVAYPEWKERGHFMPLVSACRQSRYCRSS